MSPPPPGLREPDPFLLLPGGFLPDALGFATRTTLSVLLAYLVSFWLQLDSASSAGVCVAIVAQPTPGMALSKAAWRMGGTVAGCVVALGVAAAFGQDRTMLLWAFCAWLGACTAVASLLRDFRAYGAVLCGYTVGIIAVSDIDAPGRAFDSAVNRGAAIAVGIACVAVVNGLLAPSGAWAHLTRELHRQRDAVTALALRVLHGLAAPEPADAAPARPTPADGVSPHPTSADAAPRDPARPVPASGGTASAAPAGAGVPDLAAELSDVGCARRGAAILALRTEVGYVGAELTDGRDRAAGGQAAIVAVLSMLSAARRLHRLSATVALPEDPPARAALRLHAAAAALALARPHSPAPEPPDLRRHPVLALPVACVAQLLAGAARAQAGLDGLAQGGLAQDTQAGRPTRLPAHHDLVAAALNAARTVVGTGLGAVFCIYSGWSDSTQLLVQQAAFTALLGMQPNPTAAGVGMGLALPLPLLAAAIIKFGLLPQVSGYVPFSLALAPFVFAFSLLARHPRTAGPGGSMVLFLLLVLAPANPQTYDLSAFLNTCAAQLVAVLFMVLAFRLVLPVSPRRRLYRVAEAGTRALRRRLRGPGRIPDDPAALEVLHYDRLSQALRWLGRPSPARLALFSRVVAMGELDVALCRAQAGLATLRARPAPLPATPAATMPAAITPPAVTPLAPAPPAANPAATLPPRPADEAPGPGADASRPDAEPPARAALATAQAALAAPTPASLAAAAARLLAAGGGGGVLEAAAGLQAAARLLRLQGRLLRRLRLLPPGPA